MMTPRRIYIVVIVCGALWMLAEAAAALLAPAAPSAAMIVSGTVKASIALVLAGLLLVLTTRYVPLPLRYIAHPEHAPERRHGAPDALDGDGRPLRRRKEDITATERVRKHLEEQALADDLNASQEA